MNKRIRFLREHFNLTQSDFGAKVGVKQTTVSAWESGRIVPNDSAVLSICRTFGVREEWLRTGAEPMMVQRPKDDILTDFFNSVLDDQPDSIRRRFVAALSALTPEDWENAASLMQKLVKGME